MAEEGQLKVLLAGPDYEENLSIRYLSGALLNAGHETTLAAFNSPADADAVADAAGDAEIIGLSLCFQSRAKEFLGLAQLIKSRDPRKFVVAGGHYASCAAEDLLRNHPEIDLIVIHEGEKTLVEIADAMPHLEERLPEIPGVAYRNKKRQICFSDRRHMLDDLDVLPLPDRRGPIHSIAGVPTSYLMGSRGCYGKCAYCCITTLHELAPGKRFRQRSVSNIVEEMSALYHERGTRQFVFHDDNFLVPSVAMNHARLLAFEKALKGRGIEGIALVIKCRPADAKPEVLRRLKDMGLVRMFLGVESATALGLSALHRSQSVEESVRALEACAALDISAQFTLMTFHPAATLETLRSDVAFMRRFCGNPLNFCRAEIYAGTPLEKQMMLLGRARGDYLARVYSLSDPAADLACDLSLNLFASRCWSNGSLMQRTIGLDHMVSVVKRFHDGPRQQALSKRAASWVRSVNLDTINLLDEVIELSSTTEGKTAGLEKVMRDVRERESKSRQEFLREGMNLREELETFRFTNDVRGSYQFFGASQRLARQAAAALLVIGIPVVAGCNRSQDQELKAPAPPPVPPTPAPVSHPYYGISEMAPTPLEPGKAIPHGPTVDEIKSSCSVTGTVTDTSGAAIPNATITITNVDTNLAITLKTNSAGEYLEPLLAAGRYTAKVQATAFKTTEKSGIVLKEGANERWDFVLQLDPNYMRGCCEYAATPLETPVIEAPKIDMPPQVPGNPADKTPPPIPGQPPQTPPPPASTGQSGAKCSLMGTVTDSSGAVIPKAAITITNLESRKAIILTTNEAGQFVAKDLLPGRYSVTVVVSGFKTVQQTGIVLKEAACEHVDINLKLEQFDFGITEYAAVPLKTLPTGDLALKKKPFTYDVGSDKDHNTFQGIAKLVYGDSDAWLAIFEANRDRFEKPGFIPNGTQILIPKEKRNIPKQILKVLPDYPPEARKAGVWGDVVMDVTLKDDGSVEEVNVIVGNPLLVEAATSAVKQWRYRTSAGKSQQSKFVVVVSFSKKGKVR